MALAAIYTFDPEALYALDKLEANKLLNDARLAHNGKFGNFQQIEEYRQRYFEMAAGLRAN